MCIRCHGCSARRNDDRFNPPNLPSRVPEAYLRCIRCSRRTRVRIRSSVYIAIARRSSLEYRKDDTARDTFCYCVIRGFVDSTFK